MVVWRVMKPMYRTRAYKYIHEGKAYCVWYFRLRDTLNRSNNYADIIYAEDFHPLLIDTSLPPKIQMALSFYRNRRDDVSKPNGELYRLKGIRYAFKRKD